MPFLLLAVLFLIGVNIYGAYDYFGEQSNVKSLLQWLVYVVLTFIIVIVLFLQHLFGVILCGISLMYVIYGIIHGVETMLSSIVSFPLVVLGEFKASYIHDVYTILVILTSL